MKNPECINTFFAGVPQGCVLGLPGFFIFEFPCTGENFFFSWNSPAPYCICTSITRTEAITIRWVFFLRPACCGMWPEPVCRWEILQFVVEGLFILHSAPTDKLVQLYRAARKTNTTHRRKILNHISLKLKLT